MLPNEAANTTNKRGQHLVCNPDHMPIADCVEKRRFRSEPGRVRNEVHHNGSPSLVLSALHNAPHDLSRALSSGDEEVVVLLPAQLDVVVRGEAG